MVWKWGASGEVVRVASDAELLGKADGSKPQKDLRTLGDKMTDEIQQRCVSDKPQRKHS